jgi:hypothetical protein
MYTSHKLPQKLYTAVVEDSKLRTASCLLTLSAARLSLWRIQRSSGLSWPVGYRGEKIKFAKQRREKIITHLGSLLRNKILPKSRESQFHFVVDLTAELVISLDPLDSHIDIIS